MQATIIRPAPAGARCHGHRAGPPARAQGSGFWHWAVADIPASVTELPAGAGDDTGQNLPAGAFQLRNDVRAPYFLGAAPPAGDGRHRYVIVVQAIDVEHVGQLSVQADSTPALLGFSINAGGHLLGRAVITPWAEIPAA